MGSRRRSRPRWQQPRSPALTKLVPPSLKWSRRPPLRIRIPARASACLQHARTSWLRLLAISSQISAVTARTAAPLRRLDQFKSPCPFLPALFLSLGRVVVSPLLPRLPASLPHALPLVFLALCVSTYEKQI